MYCNRLHAWWSTQSWLATFLSLWYSVLCTVESLSLLYISLYLDLYVLRDDACISQVSSYKPNSYVSWSTSELRVRLALRNRFKPSSKTFLLTVPRRYFCCRSFVLIMSSVFHAFASVNCCLVVIWRERADLLAALVCDVYCDCVTFPFGILGQVWYLIVFIPDPCCRSYCVVRIKFASLEANFGGDWGLLVYLIPLFSLSPNMTKCYWLGLYAFTISIKPDAYLHLISCGCKRKCVSVRCKCSTAPLKCTPACEYDGIDGANPTIMLLKINLL